MGWATEDETAGRDWFLAEFAFAAAHVLIFGARVLRLLAMIRGEESKDVSIGSMGSGWRCICRAR